MSDSDHAFETNDAGASLTFPMQAGALRKGGHVMMKEKPCKIVEISVSKTGKHGHAKCHIVGLDIFTDKKVEDLCPSSHNMEVPNVARAEYTLLDCDEESGAVSVLLDNGETKDDLNLPTDASGGRVEPAGEMLKLFDEGKGVVVTVMSAMGQEKIVAVKESN
jgi:translation initiation factor 5A